MAIKEFTFANFYAGLSENRYFGGEKGQFQYAENIDCQVEARGMQLTGLQVFDSTITTNFNGATGDCVLMQRLEDWFPNSSGWIHFMSGVMLRDGVTVPSLPSSGIKSWTYFKGTGSNYVFLIGDTAVDRYNVNTGAYDTAVATFSNNGFFGYRAAINNIGDILFSTGSNIHRLSGLIVGNTPPLATSPVFTSELPGQIVGITRFSSEYRIYTRTAGDNGVQYTWDGSSAGVATSVDWNGSPPIAVETMGVYDYVLAGKSEEFTDLYLATGNDRKLIRSGLNGGRGKRFYPKMKVNKDIVYISGSIDITKKGEAQDRRDCIFSYGAENAGFPNGMQIEIVMPKFATQGGSFNNIYPTDDQLYFVQATSGVIANKQYQVSKRRYVATNFVPTGSWISNTFTAGVLWTKKNIRMLVVGYSLAPELGYGGSIEIWLRNKGFGDFTKVKTITENVGFCKIYENELPNDINIFSELELKIVLNSSVDGSLTPIVYEATLIYDDNLKS